MLGNFGRIAISWGLITSAGIYAFVLSKNSITEKRLESLKIRDRMRKANCGDYEIQGDRRFKV